MSFSNISCQYHPRSCSCHATRNRSNYHCVQRTLTSTPSKDWTCSSDMNLLIFCFNLKDSDKFPAMAYLLLQVFLFLETVMEGYVSVWLRRIKSHIIYYRNRSCPRKQDPLQEAKVKSRTKPCKRARLNILRILLRRSSADCWHRSLVLSSRLHLPSFAISAHWRGRQLLSCESHSFS